MTWQLLCILATWYAYPTQPDILGLNQLFQADMELVVDGHFFSVHKVILSARCHRLSLPKVQLCTFTNWDVYLRSTLPQAQVATKTSVEIRDTTPDLLETFIEFVYRDRCRGEARVSLRACWRFLISWHYSIEQQRQGPCRSGREIRGTTTRLLVPEL